VASMDQKYTESEGWVALTIDDVILHREDTSGRIWFGADHGTRDTVLRVTYAGGYWGGFETQPVGTTQLPDDVKLAWLIQCQHVWSQRDKLGSAVSAKPGEASVLGGLDLVPSVKETLDQFTRFCLT